MFVVLDGVEHETALLIAEGTVLAKGIEANNELLLS